MKIIFQTLLNVFVLFSFLCCKKEPDYLCDVLRHAGDNRVELEKVLEYYADNTLKHKAACFLIENMAHGYLFVPIMNNYKREVLTRKMTRNLHDSIWLHLCKTQHAHHFVSEIIYDYRTVTSDYLINNIDDSFKSWEESPWYKQTDFSIFCRYILPYRVKNEPLSEWRQALRKKYTPCISGVSTPEEAFVILYNKTLTEFKKGNNLCPYPFEVLMTDKIMKGSCDDRTLYLTCILRALAIPAAYDYVSFWANFTSSGHSWVSCIRNDSTFTLTHNDQTLELHGTIDASRFYKKMQNYNIEDLPYNIDSVKKAGRVFRETYEIERTKKDTPDILRNSCQKDVSDQYGLSGFMEMNVKYKKNIFLCCFAAGKDWQPVYMTRAVKNKAQFENLNKRVVYLPCYYLEKNLIPLGSPFYITEDDTVHEIVPDETKEMRIHLNRKHVLTYHWTDRWCLFLGGKFEGSNNPDFKTKDVLHEITELPTGIVNVDFQAPKKYRYIRFIAQEDADPNFAEISFYGKKLLTDMKKHELKGDLLYNKIEKVSLIRGIDKDNSTFFRMTNTPGVPQKGYWFGYDLGSDMDHYVTGVEFCPMSDQNMIEPGDLYELFYFKDKWISLGKQVATDNHLIYVKAPVGALFWLRNLTKGKEERIFTYENDRQIWW